MALADYADYARAQAEIDQAYGRRDLWLRKAVLNVARVGYFSMDRLVREYAGQVWDANSVPPR